MPQTEWNLDRDGLCMLHDAVDVATIQRLLSVLDSAFEDDSKSVRARSSRGHIYAARNLIETIPEVTTVWQVNPMLSLLHEQLGVDCGLVRALFFDKPPDRSCRWQFGNVMVFTIIRTFDLNGSDLNTILGRSQQTKFGSMPCGHLREIPISAGFFYARD